MVLVSQSYDGASVMSGDVKGLKKRITDFCGRYVLYVHCYLHRINLIVTNVMESLPEIKEHFEITQSLYKFFKKSAVAEVYDGTTLKRLIATRWSGHYESARHVNKNLSDIVECLKIASSNPKLKSEDRALALGLLQQIRKEQFVFVNAMLLEILTPINFMVKQLQSSSENITSAIAVVDCLRRDMDESKANSIMNR